MQANDYRVETLTPDRVEEAMELVRKVFLEYDAPDYTEQGVGIFCDYIKPESIRDRMAGTMQIWCALTGDNRIVGVLAMKSPNHLSLMFVDPAHHRRGLAKMMFRAVLEQYGEEEISVHSSLYAAEVYRRLGFRDTGVEVLEDGIRYIPMTRPGKH